MTSAVRLVVVSGMSGAGKTSALKAIEDLGYEAVDNLPLALLGPLAVLGDKTVTSSTPRAIAVGIDARTRDFSSPEILARLGALRQAGFMARLLFLDADDENLQQRFTATRRRHPLALDRPISDGIAHERNLLRLLKEAADLVVDTSKLSLPDLRRIITGNFALEQSPDIAIAVVSFSYRLGLPREADLVFDARFLRNPFYDTTLRSQTGQESAVADYILADPAYPDFMARTQDLLLSLIPSFKREGKTYLTIAIGCTGGRHRSVCVATELVRVLQIKGYKATLSHRDMIRGEN